jgi:hypothetical protein
MDEILFDLETVVRGHLTDVDLSKQHKHFHVMVHDKKRGGNYYSGQLMFNPTLGWWLPDSKLEAYAKDLGKLVEELWN